MTTQPEDKQGCCAPTTERRQDVGASRPAPGRPGRRPGLPDPVGLPGGVFLMGGTDPDANPLDGEAPVREVTLGPFAIGATPVTNAEFAAFVAATGHVTEAERFGWSFVFELLLPEALRDQSKRVVAVPWWYATDGADWTHPFGPGSGLDGLERHPVVHVSWADAEAYAAWAGGRLPTEAEWEYAARGGLVQNRYAWGEELTPGGVHMCNIWQGTFPGANTAEDGFVGTSPVATYPPNGYGLFDVAGNVWEMCADGWSTRHSPAPAHDPFVPPTGPARVMRGGSHLCHASYCNRYRVAARTSNTSDSSSGNLGFRVAFDVEDPVSDVLGLAP